MAPHTLLRVVNRARRLAASRLGAVEPRARSEADCDVRFAPTIRHVAELHARHPPQVGQLQGGGERRSGIHTTKLPGRPHPLTGFTRIK